MAQTLIGQAATHDGFSRRYRDGMILFDSATLATSQPVDLPLLVDHDWGLPPIGIVRYIESHPTRGVHIVATIHDDCFTLGHRHYLSLGSEGNPVAVIPTSDGGYIKHSDIVLREVSLVEKPGASVGPVVLARCDITTTKGGYPHGISMHHSRVLDRAYEYVKRHRRADHLEVQLLDDGELDRQVDEHLAEERHRRDKRIAVEIDQKRTADYLAKKYRRLTEQHDQVTIDANGERKHTRRALGRVLHVG